jgi:hypothetical protein
MKKNLTVFFSEIKGNINEKNVIVGQIYEPPNTSERCAISRYEQVMSGICNTKNNIIIGTDQNFDLMKINQNTNVSDLFDVFLTLGVVPAINRPTRITHTSATLIDNLYVRYENYENVQSRIPIWTLIVFSNLCSSVQVIQKK